MKFDDGLVASLRDHVRESNRELAERFFGRSQLFRSADRPMEGVPWEPLDGEQFMRVFIRIWAAREDDTS